MNHLLNNEIKHVIVANTDMFTWSPANMLDIGPTSYATSLPYFPS